MKNVKEKAAEVAAIEGKIDEVLFFLKHTHYMLTFGDQIKNKNVYYEDFSKQLDDLRGDC